MTEPAEFLIAVGTGATALCPAHAQAFVNIMLAADQTPWKGFGLNPSWQEDHKVYEQMYKLSRLSAKHFLQGEWEEFCVTSPVLDARLHQINVWYTIKELWLKEPCNILL